MYYVVLWAELLTVCMLCVALPLVGRVINLRVAEITGRTVRLAWTGVAGATQYNILVLNTECKSGFHRSLHSLRSVTGFKFVIFISYINL